MKEYDVRQKIFPRMAQWAGIAMVAGVLSACPHRPAPAPYQGGAYPTQAPVTAEYGRVTNIEMLQGQQRGASTGAGAILGAVVGGVLGNQVGRAVAAAATAVGVVGGAVAGNAIEERNNAGQPGVPHFHSTRSRWLSPYDVSSVGDLRVGDRVRTINGQISRY